VDVTITSSQTGGFTAAIFLLRRSSRFVQFALNSKGERRIWIEAAVADRLTAMGRRGESYSGVILRLAEIEGRAPPPLSRPSSPRWR
jgi:hypothetical protein